MHLILPTKVSNCIEIDGKLIPAQDISIEQPEYVFYCYIMFEDGDLWEILIDWLGPEVIKILVWENDAIRPRYEYSILDKLFINSWKEFLNAYEDKIKPFESVHSSMTFAIQENTGGLQIHGISNLNKFRNRF